MIRVYEDHGGWCIDAILEGRVQRTAWALDRNSAQHIANFHESFIPGAGAGLIIPPH